MRLCHDLRASKGDLTDANPVDRGKAGSKLHVAGEHNGLPVWVVLSAANANDSTMLAVGSTSWCCWLARSSA